MDEAIKSRLKGMPPEEMVEKALLSLPGSAEECEAACDILKELGPPQSIEPLLKLYLGWKPHERDTGFEAANFDEASRDVDQAASALLQAAGVEGVRLPLGQLDSLLMGGLRYGGFQLPGKQFGIFDQLRGEWCAGWLIGQVVNNHSVEAATGALVPNQAHRSLLREWFADDQLTVSWL